MPAVSSGEIFVVLSVVFLLFFTGFFNAAGQDLWSEVKKQTKRKRRRRR
jgi:predicted PurR-regulated permease PerM